MAPYRIVLLMIAAVVVSACSGPQTASRNVTLSAPQDARASATAQSQTNTQIGMFMPNAKIESITVDVPRALTVSEKNSYFPKADIVWRGDIIGDRHEQVRSLVQESAQRLAQSMQGTRPVNMHIRVTRFHGLSEKARYTTGGVHNMNFIITLTDPTTGVILRGPREVVTNLDAFGGKDAIAADGRGETQKVRVTAFLTEVMRAEILQPGGYKDDNTGFFVALNRSN